jgi:hypothetical protein
VTLVDAQGERTHADISPDAGQAPYTAGLQEPCDPLQQVSTCGQGLACERSPDPRGGFACIQDVERCQRDTQSTLALSMEGADLIQVNGYAVEDMGPVHCWGASQGADLIYRLDVTQAGRYHIWAQGAQGESLDLSVQRGCSLAYSGQLACAVSRQTPGNTPLSAALDLEQGETIYIHVQIAGALAGGFELSVARQ